MLPSSPVLVRKGPAKGANHSHPRPQGQEPGDGEAEAMWLTPSRARTRPRSSVPRPLHLGSSRARAPAVPPGPSESPVCRAGRWRDRRGCRGLRWWAATRTCLRQLHFSFFNTPYGAIKQNETNKKSESSLCQKQTHHKSRTPCDTSE